MSGEYAGAAEDRITSGGRAVHSVCLRFFEHRLHVLPVASGFLCVLSELWSPSPVLKMAMNVTGKRMQ